MEIFRKIVFFVFTLAYIVLCPLILLYAYGYIFNPNSVFQKSFVETGLVSFSTIPSGASIYLEKRRFIEKTPTIIRDLLPGDYKVKVFLDGYRSWEKTIKVKPGKATALERIILIPGRWQSVIRMPQRIEKIVNLAQSDFFLAASGNKLEDYSVYNKNKSEFFPLTAAGSELGGMRVLDCFVSESTDSVIFTLSAGFPGEKRYIWAKIAQEGVSLRELTGFLPDPPENFFWSNDTRETVFIYKKGVIDKLDLDSNIVEEGFLKNIHGFGLSGRKIYFLMQDGDLFRMDFDQNNREIIYENSRDDIAFLKNKEFFRIQPLGQDILLFWSDSKGLYANLLPYKFLESGIIGHLTDSALTRLLVWQKDRIGELIFSGGKKGSGIFQHGPQFRWYFENGKDIRNLFFISAADSVVFQDGNGIFLLSLNENFSDAPQLLLRIKNSASFNFDEKSGEIYYVDQDSGLLSSIEIIPGENLFSLPVIKR